MEALALDKQRGLECKQQIESASYVLLITSEKYRHTMKRVSEYFKTISEENKFRLYVVNEALQGPHRDQKPSRIRKTLKICLLSVKWLSAFTLFLFVCIGWLRSVAKYLSYQTSISVTVNETAKFVYPSVTFCKLFKNESNIVEVLSSQASQHGLSSVSELNLTDIISNISFNRSEFLTLFSHPEHGDPRLGTEVLYNDSYWTQSIPHPKWSGTCYTYDPPFSSFPSQWFGIRIGIKMPGSEGLSMDEKLNQLSQLHIFLHDKGTFTFYEQDDRPGCSKLDTSLFRFKKEMSIFLTYGKLTRFPREDIPCERDLHYNFNLCLESAFSNLRGCQPPWYFFRNVNLPICHSIEEIASKFRHGPVGSNEEKDWTRPRWSTNGLAHDFGCQIPCTSSKYLSEITYKPMTPWLSGIDGDSEWILYLWFKNFQFKYEEEFIVCDATCLLGEIGGILGFLIGGSVFEYIKWAISSLLLQLKAS